jgi:hypothetical protein
MDYLFDIPTLVAEAVAGFLVLLFVVLVVSIFVVKCDVLRNRRLVTIAVREPVFHWVKQWLFAEPALLVSQRPPRDFPQLTDFAAFTF